MENKFNISIIGSGYIGLVTGACLANLGCNIVCADIDEQKINNLNSGIVPIYEPGLEDLVKNNLLLGTLVFTTNIQKAIQESDIIFIAVNTPTGKDGAADISAVKTVAQMIHNNLNNKKIICIKSTVPVGTHKVVQEIIGSEVTSIPEFLREGCAINDFMSPDRIVIGTKSQYIYAKLKSIFSLTNCSRENIIWTDNACAETIKYVSNSFLALKVSFINEIANFCDAVGVDVLSVANAVGLDKRIGNQFLKPGPGFGGSCFPKDILALIKMSQDAKVELKSIKATIEINELQKKNVVQKLQKLIKDFKGKTVAVLGVAFKANTDDVRQSPAIGIIQALRLEGCHIQIYDPKAMENFNKEVPELVYNNNAYDTCKNADAVLVLTEWPEFTQLDFAKIAQLVKQKNVLDTRNILDINLLQSLGFSVDTIGRSIVAQSKFHNFTSSNLDFKSL